MSSVVPTPDANTMQAGAGDPRVGTPDSSAVAGYKCVRCQRPIQNDDWFCSYCGYSRRKCAACRTNLLSAGEFCPHCGAARSGQQIIRIPQATGRVGGIVSFLSKYVAAPAVAVLIAAFIAAQPTIHRSTAQDFFRSYFTGVTSAKQRAQLYAQDLSASFRQLVDSGSYDGYWRTIKSVTVNSVFAVPGNSYEFTVSLTVQPKVGVANSIRVNYWLTCTGFFGNVWAKLPTAGCPESDLRFDNELSAPLTRKGT
jgi:hypothetical protein